MRKLGVLLLSSIVLTTLPGVEQASPEPPVTHHAPLLPWTDDLNQALTTAKAESLPIYLYFTGSTWCIWCKKMDQELHNTDEFRQKTVGKFLFVRVELPAGSSPSDETRLLLDKYHINGVPTAILLSPSGVEIARFRYQHIAPGAYAELLLNAHKANGHPS